MVKETLSRATTGIGSLPHHNIDAALAFSFQCGIPFLPQIPMRNPWEYMIAQALEGIPGLQIENDGTATLNVDVWIGRSHAFKERLLSAFAAPANPASFEAFEPSTAASSSWQPFLWELQEQRRKIAKIQLAGPMTAQWALRLNDNTNSDRHPDIAAQIFRLGLARALGMSRRLQAGGIQPLLYLDEPGLYGLTLENPRHALGLRELKLVVQALQKEGVWMGLHCCSNTQWAQVLGLGLDVLSLDTGLSLEPLLQERKAVDQFLDGGGRLSLGVIPTSRPPETLRHLDVRELLTTTIEKLQQAWPDRPDRVRQVMAESIFTPACGLALHSPSDAETILEALREFVNLAGKNRE